MMTLPSNVYVVLAMNYPVVFVDAKDAIDYANLTDSRPVHNCALRSREDAAELMYEFESDPAPDPDDPGYDLWLERQAALDREPDR